jgi:hypothetical protein
MRGVAAYDVEQKLRTLILHRAIAQRAVAKTVGRFVAVAVTGG